MRRRAIPNVVLRTQDNRVVRFYDDLVRDRAVVIAFIYTRCNGSCPLTTAAMMRLQRIFGERMGHDVRFLSLTLDAEHDSPAELKKYAERYSAGKGWTFLTGNAKDIETVRRSLGVTDLDPVIDADRTQHATILTFGNDRTGRWAALPSTLNVDYLAEAIERVVG